MASTSLRLSIAIQCANSHEKSHFGSLNKSKLSITVRPHAPPSRASVLSFATRRRNSAATPAAPKKTIKKKIAPKTVPEDEIDMNEDAFEALFSQLEEDLKNDDLFGEDDDITEEELAELEKELAEALADDELVAAFGSVADGENENQDEEEEEDDDGDVLDDEDEKEEKEIEIKLKNWQQRRLAYALKNGRRKTSIKNLAAELGLDRAIVLQLLRDPPPNLIMLSATLPDIKKPVSKVLVDPVENVPEASPLEETTKDDAKPEIEAKKIPVHEMQNNWSAQKRLKKVQVETMEQVYRKSKRPTNAMISSIVHVTNLPRKKVIKWFEDKRAEDGVPDNRIPYQRPETETVFTS